MEIKSGDNEAPQNQEQPESSEASAVQLEENFFKRFLREVKEFFESLISIKEEVNVEITARNIKRGIEFSGSSVWILVCSIIVASIGLNANSVAVIIGAMLISPLMGPIRGFGLALATNDIKTLITSLINFGIMVGVSLIASWAYFWLTPLKEVTSELVARTQPQVLDVMVAFFGGLAGIIAAASGNKGSAMTIIPGVAIATALMPPLCTAGYGLANHNWEFFFGALYLFILNSVFIGLSTIVTIWMLRFPLVDFVDKKREKRVKWIIFGSLLLVVIPSIIGFVNIINESIFNRETQRYISYLSRHNPDVHITPKVDFNDGEPEITLWVQGPYLEEREVSRWKSYLQDYNIGKVELEIKQNQSMQQFVDTNSIRLQTMYESKLSDLSSVAEERDFLKRELIKLQTSKLNVLELERRLKLAYPELQRFSYGEAYETNFKGNIDTIYLFNVNWGRITDTLKREQESIALKKMLQLELELKQLLDSTNLSQFKVIEY
ncbi:MAG: DUF389 domain-containing protein [Flavobacteriales bacterium]|jgi:uncharacterized hydrophobic protein (TIGR00271 family)|nr:DUF389 domain-containing protein [Flavobacteriales bacterium]